MRKTLLALVGILAAAPASAADGNGRFQILGAGAHKCSDYLSATPEQKLVVETWWAGYTTAMNRSTAATYNLVGNMQIADVNAAITRLCQDSPNEFLAITVHKVLEQAYPNRVQRSP
jgi:hypothetical protein